jgi:predicted nucleic acid-binding protein
VSELCLIDNSALQRISRSTAVAEELRRLALTGLFATCLPMTLEAGHSARNDAEHDRVLRFLRERRELPVDDAVTETAVGLQSALWHSGRVRSVGVHDLVIAAVALVHEATVVHYDADYEHVAAVAPLRHRWVVPRGSLS